jgi:hypothetical protein
VVAYKEKALRCQKVAELSRPPCMPCSSCNFQTVILVHELVRFGFVGTACNMGPRGAA